MMLRVFLLRLAVSAVIAGAAAAFMAPPMAKAATLRHQVIVKADLVTIGDLFADAGDLAGQAVFRAPAVGVTGALPVEQALAVASRAGLSVDEVPNFAAVAVVRQSAIVDAERLRTIVAAQLAERLGIPASDLSVSFDGEVKSVNADAATDTPAIVTALTLQQASGRFDAAVAIDIGASEQTITLAGRVVETLEMPVLTRPLDRKTVIHASDIRMARIERRRVSPLAIINTDELVEMAAKRPLRAGEVINTSDVEPPRLVERGQIVTVIYRKPGLSLSARGRAIADGAKGDLITVLNEQSRRTIQGIVSAAGTVEVGATAPANQLASATN